MCVWVCGCVCVGVCGCGCVGVGVWVPARWQSWLYVGDAESRRVCAPMTGKKRPRSDWHLEIDGEGNEMFVNVVTGEQQLLRPKEYWTTESEYEFSDDDDGARSSASGSSGTDGGGPEGADWFAQSSDDENLDDLEVRVRSCAPHVVDCLVGEPDGRVLSCRGALLRVVPAHKDAEGLGGGCIARGAGHPEEGGGSEEGGRAGESQGVAGRAATTEEGKASQNPSSPGTTTEVCRPGSGGCPWAVRGCDFAHPRLGGPLTRHGKKQPHGLLGSCSAHATTVNSARRRVCAMSATSTGVAGLPCLLACRIPERHLRVTGTCLWTTATLAGN